MPKKRRRKKKKKTKDDDDWLYCTPHSQDDSYDDLTEALGNVVTGDLEEL